MTDRVFDAAPASPARSFLATLLAFALMLAGAIVAPPAIAATGPQISVSPGTDLDPGAAQTLTVTGSGFTGEGAVNGVYVLFGETAVWAGDGPLPASGWIAQTWVQARQITEGSFTATLSVPAGALEVGTTYHVATSAAHALSATNRTMDAFATVTVVEPEPEPTETPSPEPTGTTSPSPEPTQTPPAPQPSMETSVVSVDAEDGATVSVTGADFGQVTGAYAAIIEKGTESGVTSGGGYVTFGYWAGAISDGGFEKSMVAATSALDRTKAYEVIVWRLHSLPTSETIYARADIGFTDAHWTTLFPPVPAVPAIEVFLADGVTPLDGAAVAFGDTLVVRGTGFDPSANVGGRGVPIPNTLPQGTYVVFGHFAEQWQPSTGAASSTRKVGSQKWALAESVLNQVPSNYQSIIRGQWADIADDGSFTAQLTVTEPSALVSGGHYGVFTYAAGGVLNAAQEREVPITIAEAPSIETAVVSVAAESGATVSVTGADFGSVTGAYAAIIEKGTEAQVTGDGGYVAFGFWMTPGAIVDGAFEKTLVAPTAKLDSSKQYEVIVWRGHSLPTAETIYARADIAFTDADWGILFPGGGTPTPTPTPTVPPAEPEVPRTPVAGGSMSWAISSSFTRYVTGDIAKGSISVGNGATRSGGLFWFGQAVESSYSAATGTGTVSYGGSVRYLGHAGVLDVTIADPEIRVTGPTSASLYVTSGRAQVLLATLNLGAAARTETNGAVTFTGAPATLTTAGVNQVFGGYSTSLDPVTFTIGTPAAAPTGSTGTVAAASAKTTSSASGVPASPPATTGIELDDETLAALGAGTSVTIEVGGFQPNEEGIALVVYSTPTVIATDLTADGRGVVRWSGVLPAALADGEHTLTCRVRSTRGSSSHWPARPRSAPALSREPRSRGASRSPSGSTSRASPAAAGS